MKLDIKKVQWILMDVEGTTTSLSFVKDILFPYAYKEMERFWSQHYHEACFQSQYQQLITLGYKTWGEQVAQLKQWIEADVKHPILKGIQGFLWEEGYRSGLLQGHLYDDVPQAFELWKKTFNLSLAIYSSGSVLSQKLLFRYSCYGDLSSYLSSYFDLEYGSKKEKDSYTHIQKALSVSSPDAVLFLSDMEQELVAAKGAGLQVCQILRPGVIPTEQAFHYNDFLSLYL